MIHIFMSALTSRKMRVKVTKQTARQEGGRQERKRKREIGDNDQENP